MERAEMFTPTPEFDEPDIRLLPGETILDIKPSETREFKKRPSSLVEMMRLTRATSVAEIGDKNPSVASLAFEVEGQKTPENLKIYETVFYRDAQYIALFLKDTYPELVRTTLLSAAHYQGVAYNTRREEEPGRIAHERRSPDDERGREITDERDWDWPYYGAVDTTSLYVRLLYDYCHQVDNPKGFLQQPYTDKAGQQRVMADSLTGAIGWIEGRCNADPEGLLEYKTPLPHGIENQVWKDSYDSYHHADGTLANHDKGIAALEVQVSTYDALLDAAELYATHLTRHQEGERLLERAARLRQTILDIFWTEDKGGYFVIGTDRDDGDALRQLKIRTSNMGHVLNSRLLDGDEPEVMRMKQAVIHQLMSPEMLNVSGIRTLASDEVRFRPGSYHNGSVWPWDTYYISLGMRRHGFVEQADHLEQCILGVINTTNEFPEYARGDTTKTPSLNRYTVDLNDTINHKTNRIEQPPQEVQGWTVAAALAIKQRRGHHHLNTT